MFYCALMTSKQIYHIVKHIRIASRITKQTALYEYSICILYTQESVARAILKQFAKVLGDVIFLNNDTKIKSVAKTVNTKVFIHNISNIPTSGVSADFLVIIDENGTLDIDSCRSLILPFMDPEEHHWTWITLAQDHISVGDCREIWEKLKQQEKENYEGILATFYN